MRFFKLKQGGFHGQTAAVADQTAVRADDAVTGSRDIDGVAIVRHADCAGGFRLSDCPGNIAVGARFAVGNVTQRRPDLALKRRALRAAGEVKAASRSGEILVQLTENERRQRVLLALCGVLLALCGVLLGFPQGNDLAVLLLQLKRSHGGAIDCGSFHSSMLLSGASIIAQFREEWGNEQKKRGRNAKTAHRTAACSEKRPLRIEWSDEASSVRGR